MIETGTMTRKHMNKITTTKPKDMTSKHVKNTQTGVWPKASFKIRWYHIVSLVVVAAILVVALAVLFSRVDPSLISSKYTIKYYIGCTTSFTGQVNHTNASYRYAGASDGMMFGKKGITDNPDEAYLKIIKISDGSAKVEQRSYPDFEWAEQDIRFGKEYAVSMELAPDCMPGITYTINQ